MHAWQGYHDGHGSGSKPSGAGRPLLVYPPYSSRDTTVGSKALEAPDFQHPSCADSGQQVDYVSVPYGGREGFH